MSNESNDWSFMTLCSPPTTLPSSMGSSSHTPSHLKPPVEVPSSGIPDEETDSTIFIVGGPTFPYNSRLASPTEDSFRPFTSSPSANLREEQTSSGNSLGVHGGGSSDQMQGPVPIEVQEMESDQVQGAVNSGQLQGLPSDLQFRNRSISSAATNTAASSSNHQRDIFDNVNNSYPVPVNNIDVDTSNFNIFKYLVEPKNNPVVNNGSGVSSQANSSTTSFPPEPTILADKYAILGPVDASTCHGISLRNHDTVHVKAVSPRTAREVCGQQAMLVHNDGVRAPIEAVVSVCGKRAWLVFPPHFGDLHSYVRLRRRLREAEAQRLFAQVAATVENCHSSGLVLRDLKLRKFVFTDFNRQQVVLESVEDSVVAGESDLLHDKHGCPAYVAPEILLSSAYSGRHADMWGLGVILYTMLVGRYPFHHADTSVLFAKIRRGKFLVPEWVSSRARHLMLSLLRGQPQRRLTAQQVLMHPWLNRVPRDHVGKDIRDHIVPSDSLVPSIVGKGKSAHN